MRRAIVTLSRGWNPIQFYSNLIIRNKFIEENLNNPCDLIIFHEGDITKNDQYYLQSKTILPLKFTTIYKFKEVLGIEVDLNNPWADAWSYKHMCNFWFSVFLSYLDNYDLIIRIDDDCIVRSNLDEVFESLVNKTCVYAKWVEDEENVTRGLNQFTLENTEADLAPRTPSGPYTNFVGFNLIDIRNNHPLLNYLNKVTASNNIFIHRWGDAPLWGEALHYFVNKSKHELVKVKYYHGSHNEFVNYEIGD